MYEREQIAKQAAYAAQMQSQGIRGADAPPPPTRFSNAAGQLEARVAHLNGLVERASRVADRLGGPVPEEAMTAQGKLKGSGNCVASIIENSMDDLDTILARAERHIQRLEQL